LTPHPMMTTTAAKANARIAFNIEIMTAAS
jgi:hypothetical protein